MSETPCTCPCHREEWRCEECCDGAKGEPREAPRPLAPWFYADGSTEMLPMEVVERRRKLAAKVLDLARTVVRANGAGLGGAPAPFVPGLAALEAAVNALDADPAPAAAAPREAPPPDWRELLVDVAREFNLLGCTLRDLPALLRAKRAEAEALLAAARAERDEARAREKDWRDFCLRHPEILPPEPARELGDLRCALAAAEERERALREALEAFMRWVREAAEVGVYNFTDDEGMDALLTQANRALAEEGSPRG